MIKYIKAYYIIKYVGICCPIKYYLNYLRKILVKNNIRNERTSNLYM